MTYPRSVMTLSAPVVRPSAAESMQVKQYGPLHYLFESTHDLSELFDGCVVADIADRIASAGNDPARVALFDPARYC